MATTKTAKGWTVVANTTGQGLPWIARAWDARARRYRSKRHESQVLAETWAAKEHLRMTEGLSAAGRVSINDIATDYLEDLERYGASPAYIKEQKRVLAAAVSAGITDLQHPRVVKHALAWLGSLTCLHRSRQVIDEKGVATGATEMQPISPKYRNEHLLALRTLGNFALKHRRITFNPFTAIRPVKVPEKIKPTFRLEELATLVSLKRRNDPYWLMFNVLCYTGMRELEAVHMKWEWIDWKAKRIIVHLDPAYRKKLDKEHITTLQPELAAILKRKADLVGFIFPADMRALTSAGHNNRFKAYLGRCGIPIAERSPHSTRHTFISVMLATGENQIMVQAYAGHSELSTTAGYAKTQGLYREAVKDWPRGELSFRHGRASQPAAQVPAPGVRVKIT